MKPYLTRKESIVISAIEIIDKKGIIDLTLRDIAEAEGVSEAALYKHFNSREEIIMEILEYFSRYDVSIIDTIKSSSMLPKEAIIFFISSFVESVESHPAMSCIVNYYEVLTREILPVKKTKDIFKVRLEFLKELIDKGQTEGFINYNFTCEELAIIITGVLRTYTLQWRMNKYNFNIKDSVLSAVDTLLKVC